MTTINSEALQYIERIEQAIEQGRTGVCQSLTRVCPECELEVDAMIDEHEWEHGMIGPWVIVGCEGYYVIDPNLVGIDSPNWSDWRNNSDG